MSKLSWNALPEFPIFFPTAFPYINRGVKKTKKIIMDESLALNVFKSTWGTGEYKIFLFTIFFCSEDGRKGDLWFIL